MSAKYTREQIDKARQLADHAFSETARRNRQHDGDIVAGAMRRPADEWIDTFTEALGLEVQPEKPEPGVYLDSIGNPVILTGAGMDYAVIDSDSNTAQELAAHLTPARVVPAAPVELTEEEVAEEWNASTAPYYWSEMQETRKDGIMQVFRALLAKHGHGRAGVKREQVDGPRRIRIDLLTEGSVILTATGNTYLRDGKAWLGAGGLTVTTGFHETCWPITILHDAREASK